MEKKSRGRRGCQGQKNTGGERGDTSSEAKAEGGRSKLKGKRFVSILLLEIWHSLANYRIILARASEV